MPLKSRASLAALALTGLLSTSSAIAQVCAPPSALQTGPTSGIVNTYYVPGSTSLPVGATSLMVGTASGNTASYGASTPVVGDLLLVMQMQDATFNTANNSGYGNGSGQGSTSVRNAGQHEFVRVTAATGSNITFTPPLQYAYNNTDATASTPRRRYQVVRVRQYSSLAANGITAPKWDGQTGGVVAVDVRDTLTLNNGTVEGQSAAFFAAGKGYRGGAGRQLTANGGWQNDWATVYNYHGGKGEGIAGMPRYYADLTSSWGYRGGPNAPAITIQSLTSDSLGYPGGSAARGAPGNAGGGGSDGSDSTSSGTNQYNAGGGGGSNYGPGGIGGRPWSYPLVDSGGRGGAGYSGTVGFGRVFLGGGGGAGGTNNGTQDNNVRGTNQAMACALASGICSSGAPGGGIVIIRARSISGGGVIDVRGAHGYNVDNDAAGGGGGGGSVVLHTVNGGNATISAQGGDGGNAYVSATGTANRHGPGGGGGGGFVAYSPSSISVSANVAGGVPGITSNGTADHYDANGYNGGLTTFQTPNTPGVPPAALCEPNLVLAKSNGVSELTSPGTTTYSLTVTNTGNGASSGTVAIADKLPAGLSVVPGALTLSGPNAGSWSCTASNATDVVCTSASSISGSGGSSTFAFDVAVSAANGSALTNRARVGGGSDPTKSTPPTPADAAACTANDTPAGCAVDADTVTAPNLTLTKTDNASSVLAGGTTSYTLVVSNTGGTATTGTIGVVDTLPTGLSFSSAPTANGFTCSHSAPTVTCTRSTALPAGASATITLVVTVNGDAPSSVTNLARVGGGGDPSPGKSTPPTATSTTACAAPVPPATTSSDPSIGCAADVNAVNNVRLSLSKEDGAPYMNQNGTVDYRFTVTNSGTSASTGTINFRDVLPAPMTFPDPLVLTDVTPASSWACTRQSGTAATCVSNTSIPAGGSSSFTLRTNVNAATIGSQYTNKARVGGGGDASTGMVNSPTVADVTACTTDGNPAGCAIDMNTVQSAPRIRMTKSHADPQARAPGTQVSFSLVVSNSGGSTAGVGTVQVIDVLPTGMTYDSATGTGFTCANSGQVVNCRNATSTDGTGGTAGTYALAAGASRTITVVANIAATATNDLLNLAKVAASGDPQNSTPLTTSTANLDIVRQCTGTDSPHLGCAVDLVPLNADLQVTKLQRTGTAGFATSMNSVPSNQTVQFQIDVTNSGPSRITAAQVVDNVPTNFTNVTWTCAVQNNGTGTGNNTSCGASNSGTGNTIELTTGHMRVDGVLRITVNALATYVTGMAGVTNTAVVTAPSGIIDPTPGNNSASVNTLVGSANLSIVKTNNVGTVTAGTTTTYTITVENTGNFPADGSRLHDPVVAGLSCTAPPTCTATGPATSCPPSLTATQLQNNVAPEGVQIPTLGAGGRLVLTYTCQVTATGQ